MPNASLHATSALDGFSQTFGDTRLWETSQLLIMSVALPSGGRDALDQQLQQLAGLAFPDAGSCQRAEGKLLEGIGAGLALLGVQKDQCLLTLEPARQSFEQALNSVHSLLEKNAYLTDQSDSLAVLDIQGPLARPALERICMLDLSRFDANRVARTLMEHMSIIIEMPGPEQFRLYAPRSSARSFLHTITTALSGISQN